MRPFRANAADLSFEKYFGIKGYVSAQFYYKYFDTFVVEQNIPNTLFDYTGFPIPAGLQTTDPTQVATYLPPQGITEGFIQRPVNVKGGKMYGIGARRDDTDRRLRTNARRFRFHRRSVLHQVEGRIFSAAPRPRTCQAIRSG